MSLDSGTISRREFTLRLAIHLFKSYEKFSNPWFF